MKAEEGKKQGSLGPTAMIEGKVESLSISMGASQKATLLQTKVLQNAVLHSANFAIIATDANGVIQLFNVGAERLLGYSAVDVINKMTPSSMHDSQEVIARAEDLSTEFGISITPGFCALAFKASHGIEDQYELTYIRKDGSRFPARVSITALRDANDEIVGYLLTNQFISIFTFVV